MSADDSPEGPQVVGAVEVGEFWTQLEIVERFERQAAGRTDAAGDRLQSVEARFAGEKQRAARLGDGEVAEERGAAGERNQQVGRERRFERLEGPEDAAGLGGGQDAGDQVAGLELARVELGGGEEGEPVVVGGVLSVEFGGDWSRCVGGNRRRSAISHRNGRGGKGRWSPGFSRSVGVVLKIGSSRSREGGLKTG